MRIDSSSAGQSSVVARLRAAGCVFAEDEARLLIAEAATPADLETMVASRVAGLPLEQVVGWVDFCGLRLAVEPEVFVPRRRTEFLARQSIELLRNAAQPVALDLCCGAGAIGAAIAAHVSPLELYAADIQPAAVRCARRNIGDRGLVFEGDLFAPLPAEIRGRLTVVVANAPYVPTDKLATMPPEARLYEPRVTLDGGADGLDLHRRLADSAPSWLAPRGHLLMECSERQAPRLTEIFNSVGLSARVAHFDEADATVVIGTKRVSSG